VRPLDDVFARLAGSPFRRRFRLGPKERDYLAAKGMETILHHARDFIARRLAAAEPANDGRQTPMRGHPVFIAQHASATCCRSCVAKWHGISVGRPLTEAEQAHLVGAIERWLAEARLPPPRHSRERGNPAFALNEKDRSWTPAFAGVTGFGPEGSSRPGRRRPG
jgi:hypothetical protein